MQAYYFLRNVINNTSGSCKVLVTLQEAVVDKRLFS